MSISQLTSLSHICLFIALILIILDIVFFFTLDINKAWHITTGKQIKSKQARENGTKHTRRFTQKISTQKLQKLHEQKNIPNASVQNQNIGQQTTLLQQNTQTTLLDGQDRQNIQETTALGQTVELPKRETTPLNMQQSSETTDLGVFRVKYDVTFIHTEEKI